MADNVIANPGVGGATFATDDDGTAHHPYTKIEFGADGTFTKVSTSDPLPVVQTGALPAGANAIGKLAANSGVDIGDVDVTSVSGNVTVVQATATNLKVDASGVAVPVTDNAGSLTVDNAGTFAVQNNSTGKTMKTASGTLTSDTDVIAAVSSKRIKVYAMNIFTVGTNANAAIFKSNGTSGTELWRFLLQGAAASPMGLALAVSPPGFLFATVAGEKLTLDVGNADTLHYSLSYWDDDAT